MTKEVADHLTFKDLIWVKPKAISTSLELYKPNTYQQDKKRVPNFESLFKESLMLLSQEIG